ncbi:MAG TPA: rhomboid family intramembrane serine protease [Streptosporangiaceae bacterium]|nr:rhomboid family intramembrane serine protease [Streptosporangiaceae bacterium]
MVRVEPEQTQAPVCYRHSKRETYVRCTRCDRYICPDCMRDAAVGHQCVECVREGNKTVRQARTVFGGQISVTPWVTYVLIAINVLAYLGELVRPGIVGRFDNLGEALVNDQGTHFVIDGHSYPGYHLIGIAQGEWYRLITSAFLHALPSQGFFGISHIVLNMAGLWVLGRLLENLLGWWRYLALYLLCALGSSVLFFLIAPLDAALGASGAIFGLAAAYFVFSRRLRQDLAGANRLILTYLVWMVLTAGITAWQGHLGGLLTGGLVGLAFAYVPKKQRTFLHLAAAGATLLLLIVLVLLKTSSLTGS